MLHLVKTDPYMKAALISEIKLLKVLKSPNIVGFLDVMESVNNYYLVQELCDGDLAKMLSSKPKNRLP